MERIRVAALVFSLLLLLQIIRAVRREHIRVEYSMAWFGAAVLLLALSISEPTLRWLSLTLGIDVRMPSKSLNGVVEGCQRHDCRVG